MKRFLSIILALFISFSANAAPKYDSVQDCVSSKMWKTIGAGATYGLVVGGVVGVVGAATLPAGAAVSVTGLILYQAIYTGAAAGGGAAMAVAYIDKEVGNPYAAHCIATVIKSDLSDMKDKILGQFGKF